MCNTFAHNHFHINIPVNHKIPFDSVEINFVELEESLLRNLNADGAGKITLDSVSHSPGQDMQIVDYMTGGIGVESAFCTINESVGNLAVGTSGIYVNTVIVVIGRLALNADVFDFSITTGGSDRQISITAYLYVASAAIVYGHIPERNQLLAAVDPNTPLGVCRIEMSPFNV